jgi:UDP:flavonoid glycosyltransferase YjiC (YdhE family)
VLGIPGNLDQYLASERIDQVGVGLSLRSGRLTVAEVRSSVQRLLSEPSFAHAARDLAQLFTRNDAASNFRSFIRAHVGN